VLTPPVSPAEQDHGEGFSFLAASRLVAEREIKAFVRMKGFWVGLGVIIVALFAISILPGVFGGGQTSVATVGSSISESLEGGNFRTESVTDVSAAEDLVRSEEVDAAVVPDSGNTSGTGMRVLALSERPDDVMAALSSTPPVELLDNPDTGSGEQHLVILVFSLVFIMFGMSGIAVAQSTVTEKQTRVVEILVSTIPIRALLAGKIAGHSLLTIGQVVLIALLAPVALQLGGHANLLSVIAPALGWFVPFLCLGFVLLTTMWAVTGSMVSRQEDLGSSMGLVMTLVMGPYLAVLLFQDNASVMTPLSYVPFSAPLAMPVRWFAGEAQVWEPLLALGIMVVAVVVAVQLASRLYAGSLLHTRGKVGLRNAWQRAS